VEITPDGYRIVPPISDEPDQKVVGAQCGQCGLRIKDGEAICYVCQHRRCPMGLGSYGTL
jgi:hypothetical protein